MSKCVSRINLTIKNTSNATCQIIGNNFIDAHFDSAVQNINITHSKQLAVETFKLTPSQTLYSLLTYGNGAQCQNAPKEQVMTLSYAISPTDSVTFQNPNPPLLVPDCTVYGGGSTGFEVPHLSDTPITP